MVFFMKNADSIIEWVRIIIVQLPVRNAFIKTAMFRLIVFRERS